MPQFKQTGPNVATVANKAYPSPSSLSATVSFYYDRLGEICPIALTKWMTARITVMFWFHSFLNPKLSPRQSTK